MRRLAPRFDLDGTCLALHRGEGLVVCDPKGSLRWQATIAQLVDFSIVSAELWAITPTTLHRFRVKDGKPVADHPIEDLDREGRLVVSGAAPSLPIWRGRPSRVLRVHQQPVVQAAGFDDGWILPLAEGRWIGWEKGAMRLWRPIGDAWRTRVGDPNAPVLDGQVVLDGRLVAIAQQRAGASELKVSVVSTRDGSQHTTVRLPQISDLRFATRRGYAIARTNDRLIVVDLRFGRFVRELIMPEGALDFAVDDGMRHVAILDAGGVSIVAPDELASAAMRASDDDDDGGLDTPPRRRPEATTQAEPSNGEQVKPIASELGGVDASSASRSKVDLVLGDDDGVMIDDLAGEESATADEDDVAPELLEPLPDAPLVLLDPVAVAPVATPAEIAQALDMRMNVVGARVAAAIADAWDTGRLVHANPLGLPYAEEVAGILKQASGLATDALAEAVARVQSAENMMMIVDRARTGRLTPLDVLARDFHLTPLAVSILLVLSAPQLRGDYARLYGILSNDPSRSLVDEQLIGHVLAGGGGAPMTLAIARELDADRPLRKYGLIAVGGGSRPFSSLAVDPLVVRAIANQPAEGEPDQHMRIRHADRDLEVLQLPRPLVIKALRFLARPRPGEPVRIVVRGRTGNGRHSLLAALAARAGRSLGVIDTTTVPREPGRLPRVLEMLLRRAMLRGVIPCVDGLEMISAEDPDTKVQIAHVLREHPGPVALRLPSEAQIPLEPGYLLIDIPSRNERQRTESWKIAIAHHGIVLPDPSDLAARYRVGPGVIERVCAEVMRRPDPPTTPQLWIAALDDAVRQHLENRLGTTANRVTRLSSWADVVLPEDILDSLLELTARVRHRKKVFETWGFDKSITSARGITALFSGSPGTGKTMVAGVIARDLGLELYRVDVARITSKWIGETEKNLGSLFDAAEDGQVMLLFDEADSLFAKRTEVKSSVDRYANMEVNYLLQRLDSFEGIAILTTNFGSAIDPAFKRRLSFRVTFPFPDEDMREKLWKALIPPEAPVTGAMDFARLAQKFKLSGGYIRNAALRAAFLAAEEGSTLTQDHIERAIRMEFREIGKLADSGVLE